MTQYPHTIMFTGIVETIATVESYKPFDDTVSGGKGVSLTIKDASEVLTDVHLGDSIAINGCCLTVTEFCQDCFKVGISPETLRKTNLGSLKESDKVNLERAIKGDVRFGGHMVQGHVDTIAEITSAVEEENSIIFTFSLRDKEFINYIVHKGFICLDGTSLTVTHVNPKGEFQIMMVSYTQSKVIMPLKKVGDFVNVEVDLTGKLIEKQVNLSLNAQIQSCDSPLVKLIEKLVSAKVDKMIK